MTDEPFLPPERDLPPGRLQRRKEHLVNEVSVWDRAARRRRRRFVLVLVPAIIVLLGLTGFTTYALTREPTHFESIGCFETADVDGNIAIVNTDGRDPVAICTELWRNGVMGRGPAPESLAACVLETGPVGVFPSSGEDTCERLGLADLPPTYAARSQRFAELRDALRAAVDFKCLGEEEARAAATQVLARLGFAGWHVEVDPGRDGAPWPRAVTTIDQERKTVVVLMLAGDGRDCET
jgi:hypothetical protein